MQCINQIVEYIFITYKSILPIDGTIHQDDTELIEDIDNNLETELINILINLRTNRRNINEENQEFTDVEGIERMLMREMYLAMILSNLINNVRQENNNNNNRKFNILTSIENDENEIIDETCDCNICWEENKKINFIKLGCNHEFCKDCVIKTLKSDQRVNPCCALCRSEIKSIKTRTEIVQNELSDLIA